MRAEDLIQLAAAHGVDLIQAARMSSNAKLRRDVEVVRFANGRKASVLMQPTRNRVSGKESPSTNRPEWTLAELGQASHNVPNIPFQAACFAFAGDRSCYWSLHGALYERAIHLQMQEKWPREIFDLHGIQRPYLKHLALLVLDEDQSPALFRLAGGILYPIYLGVHEKVWFNQVLERFLMLKDVWGEWLGTASRMIQANLSGDEGSC